MARRNTDRITLAGYWLEPRKERNEWVIAWYDRSARTRRRKSTGIPCHGEDTPPAEAQKALAEHVSQSPSQAKSESGEVSVSDVLGQWLNEEGSKKARASQNVYAIGNIERWMADERGKRRFGEFVSTNDLTKRVTKRYITFRKKDGVVGETISSELSVLRSAMNWAEDEGYIEIAPRIAKVDKEDRSDPRDTEYDFDQVAALLEAAVSRPERHHIALFTMCSLSTHGRTEAILEATSDQIDFRRNRIDWLGKGRKQTSKRRTVVPIAPTLRPWLEPIEGKLIVYRTFRKDGSVYEKPTVNIINSFKRCLLSAAKAHPSLGLAVPAPTEDDPKRVKALGSPNTLRHTLHTYLQVVGVPQAQIDLAAGHAGERGSGRNYTHLRPEYLGDFVEAVEAYWAEILKLTDAPLRSQFGPKIVSIAPKGTEKNGCNA